MFFDFSICESPEEYGGIALDTIYYINGDHTYCTPKKDITPGKTYFLYTLQGAGIVSFNGKSFTVTSNHFIFIQPDTDFSYRTKSTGWEFWWFEFTGESVYPPNRLDEIITDKFLIALLSKSLEYTKRNDWKLSTALFNAAVLIIKRNANRPSRALVNEQIVSAIENHIRKNFATVTVHELSEEFGIEERTLRNLFNKTMGMTPKHFILKVRLEYASNLLLTSQLSLSSIAQKTGFANQYHFSKAFKEFFGISPEKYRKFIGLW